LRLERVLYFMEITMLELAREVMRPLVVEYRCKVEVSTRGNTTQSIEAAHRQATEPL
jgi:hypothetical protein